MSIKRLAATLAAIIMITFGTLLGPTSSAFAASPKDSRAGSSVSWTLNSSIPRTSDVASLWSRTAVDMVVGPCSGAGCITVKVVNAPCVGGYLGCAYGWNYAQGCTVEVSQWVLDWSRQYDLPDFAFNVLGHEVGHCVIGSAWHDTSAERSIMYPTLHYGDRARGLTKPVKDKVAGRVI